MTAVADDARNGAALDLHSEPEPMLVVGEIHSGMLQNSGPITAETAAEMLATITDHPVRRWERPIRHAASGQMLTGVDCFLPPTSGPRRRVVGTVRTELSLTGGRLVQASAQSVVLPATESRRLSWSHYLSRPGVLEVSGSVRASETADSFLNPPVAAQALDLGGVCVGLLGRAQSSTLLDRGAPFRAPRTRLRWAALPVPANSSATVAFTIESSGLRTLRIAAPAPVLRQLSLLCQDVALHDWLVSTVDAVVESADIGRRGREGVVRHLRPAIDNLLYAWMPAARLPDELVPFWHEIDRRSGLSVHWAALVQRVRDQLALAMLERNDVRAADTRTAEVDVRSSASAGQAAR